MIQKIKTLFIALIAFGFAATGQSSNAVLFTENGEQFTVILNGLRKNDKPQTNVKLTGLTSTQYKLKIIFVDTKIPELATNLFLEPGTERSFSVKKNTKGTYVLRMISEDAIATDVTTSEPNYQQQNQAQPSAVQQSDVVQTTVTTTDDGTSGGAAINMGISISDNGVSINASGFDTDANGHVNSTTTTTTTTTTSHSTVSGNIPPPPPPPTYLPGYNGPIGCPVPMSKQDFNDLKSTVSSKSFEETKLTIAKQVLQNHCLLTSQVKELCALFTFEENKLEYAKYAYDYTYDIGNYFKVNDVFTFESSTEELNQYIRNK
nr:DUF4476 domain-containing protein [Bacteroidota bacterium]